MRVIAGELGGRRLLTARGDATRPTAERVREALFSMLGTIEGAVVLELDQHRRPLPRLLGKVQPNRGPRLLRLAAWRQMHII